MQKIMVNVLKPGDVVYDLGANFGLHGLLCSKIIGSKGCVYNFEPLPNNIKEIDRNYRLNGVKNYRNIPMAVSNENVTLNFTVAKHATQGKVVKGESDAETIPVQATTLDHFIETSDTIPSFIKMDIEDAEGEALEGYANNIEKSFPIMIIELHSLASDMKVGKFLKYFKYKAYRFNTFRNLKFQEIKDFSLPYPAQEGMWGSILCIGPHQSINNFTFNK